jgi:hypothetical protein
MPVVGSSRTIRSLSPGGGEGEADALRLAAGELVDLAVGDLGDARAGDHVTDLVRLRVQVAGQLDQFADRDLVHQPAALQHRAHPPGDDGLARAGAEDADRAAVGLLEAEQQVEGGRLAGPVRAQQGHRLPGCSASDSPSTARTLP